jgi:hypothetical protein
MSTSNGTPPFSSFFNSVRLLPDKLLPRSGGCSITWSLRETKQRSIYSGRPKRKERLHGIPRFAASWTPTGR